MRAIWWDKQITENLIADWMGDVCILGWEGGMRRYRNIERRDIGGAREAVMFCKEQVYYH